MANIYDYYDEYDSEGNECLSLEAANRYASDVAREAIQSYIKQSQAIYKSKTQGGNIMPSKSGIQDAANAVMTETTTNAAIISGEILLENIETVANSLILSRLSWWKRLTISTKDKEIAITVATYAIVHAIKTGGFGLTKYTINHVALDYVTLAANARMLRYIVKATGVDTNVAKMFLTMPTVSAEG